MNFSSPFLKEGEQEKTFLPFLEGESGLPRFLGSTFLHREGGQGLGSYIFQPW
jgi:hypothetical protein